MTIDQDRGAYAPHMDAPLAFDARRPTDRRPLPMTLIASAGVLVLIVGALAMAYRGGVRGSEQPKLVGEPVGAIKTAAAPEAASDAADTHAKLDVYSPQNVPAKVVSPAPNFAPAPEQPKPRPVVVAQVATAPTGLQVRTVDPVKVRIGEPEVTAAPVLTAADRQAAATSRTAVTAGAADRAPQPVPVAKPAALAQAAPAPVKAPRADAAAVPSAAPSTKTASSKAAVAATTPAKGSPTRTVASDDTAPAAAKPAKSMKAAVAADAAKPVRTSHGDDEAIAAKPLKTAHADADAASAKVAKPVKTAAADAPLAKAAAKTIGGAAAVQVGAFSSAELAQKGFADAGKLSALGGHAKSVEKISRDGKTFYRATLGGFADKAAAKAFCAKLTAAGGRCLVKS